MPSDDTSSVEDFVASAVPRPLCEDPLTKDDAGDHFIKSHTLGQLLLLTTLWLFGLDDDVKGASRP